MTELVPAVLVAGFVVAAVFVAIRTRGAVDIAVKRSFEALTFSTPAGRVRGKAMRVVKAVEQKVGSEHSGTRDLFWYCVGSGPSYFLALGHVQAGRPPVRVDWVVRALTQERMRNALAGDDRAIALAFGSAVEG